MNLKFKAEKAVKSLETLLGESWSEQQADEARRIIETAMSDAVHHASSEHERVVAHCCSADQDMAHKLSEELGRAREALLANLISMR